MNHVYRSAESWNEAMRRDQWAGWYRKANSFCKTMQEQFELDDQELWEYIWALDVARRAGINDLDDERRANYVDYLESEKVSQKIRKGREDMASGATLPEGLKAYFPFEFER